MVARRRVRSYEAIETLVPLVVGGRERSAVWHHGHSTRHGRNRAAELGTSSCCISNVCSISLPVMQTWEAQDPPLDRPLAAPLGRCAELLGVDLATVREAAARVQPYLRVDGTEVWSLMQLERQLRPQAFGRVRGGYIARRRVHPTGA
jgi:hypothetical protein